MRLHRQLVKQQNRVGACVALLRVTAYVCLIDPKPPIKRLNVQAPHPSQSLLQFHSLPLATISTSLHPQAQYQKHNQNP